MSETKNTTPIPSKNQFQTTHWTTLGDPNLNEEQRRQMYDEFLIRYWQPVYFYLRCQGHNNDAAEDLTQGFFCEIVLGNQLLQKADKEKGRFRNFLLKALKNYITYTARKENALKRRPPNGVISFSELQIQSVPLLQKRMEPDDAFNHAWTQSLLTRVINELKHLYLDNGKETHWKVFEARFLNPIITGTDPPPLPEVCREFGIERPGIASNMIARVKLRFRSILLDHIKPNVSSKEQAEEEINELINILSKNSAS